MGGMNSDTAMVVAAIVISAVHILERYPTWNHMRER